MDFDNEDDEQKEDSTPDPRHAHNAQEQEISDTAENEAASTQANDTEVDDNEKKKKTMFFDALF